MGGPRVRGANFMFKKLSKIKPKGGKFEDFYLLAHLCSVSVKFVEEQCCAFSIGIMRYRPE